MNLIPNPNWVVNRSRELPHKARAGYWQQDNAVCQVSLKFQGYRTAIDKRILGEQR